MSESSDTTILKQIEDYLAPRLKLDAYERILYYYLFRHTRLIAKSEIILSIPQLAESLNCSKNVVKKRLKSLSEKGVINITDAGWSGTKISVFLPSEIHGVLPIESDSEKINIEEVNFYSDARFRQAIFDREEGCCFYCRRKLTPENRGLDHVDPRLQDGLNSYRNVVAACHTCNSSKGDTTGEDFIRALYRRGLLNNEEVEDSLKKIVNLKDGKLKPDISL